MAQVLGLGITIVSTGIQLITSAVSAQGTIPTASSGEVPRYIRVSATVAACIRLGTNPTAVVTDAQVQPGDSLILSVPLGITKIAAVQVAAAGVVQVSPLENM